MIQTYLENDRSIIEKKIKLTLKIFKMIMFVIGGAAFMRLYEHDTIQFIADILLVVIVTYAYVKLASNYKYYLYSIRIVFTTSILMTLFLFYNHPELPIKFIWFSTVAYFIFYLFDKQEAQYWIWLIGLLLLVLYIFWPEIIGLTVKDYMIWILNLVIVLMVSSWYASFEKESSRKMKISQYKLADMVKKRTEQLTEKTIALERKTQELEELNKDLEKRIAAKISQIREHEQLLFRQAKYAQMGEILNMIAHQWRQPLSAISTANATIQFHLKNNKLDTYAIAERSDDIVTFVRHLSSSIDDFRSFFRQDKEKSIVSFNQIIDNSVELVGALLKNHNISLYIDEQCKCTIYTYKNELLHVVLNLIKNAEDELLSRNVEKPSIYIRTFHLDGDVVMEIEDNAGGIEPHYMEKIFDPYFTTKEENGGTGLGLYMSRIIIEEHCNGKLDVKNGEKGALFQLRFQTLGF